MERWRQIESLFQKALGRPVEERDAWLREACAKDQELHQEVVSLLANHHESISAGPWAAAAAQLIVKPPLLEPGQFLGPYQVTSFLAAGGMGEVYRARDTKLKRDVALKVLPEEFARDPGRMRRFQREAEVLASLNHPNIAAVYGVEERALVMEFVEGESPKGPMPFEDAWKIASQIAEGLTYAHEKGIIHRDLKPSNIKVTPDGIVKLLDFGLAKAYSDAPDTAGVDPADSPTMTLGGTVPGVILGTAAYMAPEQAKGKRVDKRADIWSWGVVLYELLTGEQLFKGENTADTLAHVLTQEPKLDKLPLQVRKLLRLCLDKDPQQRLRDIGDTKLLLEEAHQHAAAPKSGLRWKIATAALAVTAAAFAYISYLHWNEPRRVLRLSLPPPEKGSFSLDYNIPAVSPDGRHVAFVANSEGKSALWVRDLDSLSARQLPGTEESRFPFWSPDSRVIAFFTNGGLKKIDAGGGPAVVICAVCAGQGGSWSKDNVIVFTSPTVGLSRVPAEGGTPAPVTTIDRSVGETSHRFPWFLPDGRHFLYIARNADRDKSQIFVGDIYSRSARAVALASSNAVYTPPGYLLFLRERTLMAQPFDAGQLRLTGVAAPVAEKVDFSNQTALAGQFSVSQNGMLAYSSGIASDEAQLTWFDRTGAIKGTLGKPGDRSFWPAISPDGRTVAVDRRDLERRTNDIWTYNLATGIESRFTFGPGANIWPVWSPDASYIAFSSTRDGGGGSIYRRATTGADHDEFLNKIGGQARILDWSRDGRYLVEEGFDGNSKDIWVVPLLGGQKPFPYVRHFAFDVFAKLSPNGQWLAYDSSEFDRTDVYVQTFPKPGGKWQVSTNGGSRPVWSRDGTELYFISPDRKMMAVKIKGGPRFDHDAPQTLFDSRIAGGPNAWFDVSKDGRFLIPAQVEQSAKMSMTLVVNWSAALKK
jgi:serine/threonine protein kinase